MIAAFATLLALQAPPARTAARAQQPAPAAPAPPQAGAPGRAAPPPAAPGGRTNGAAAATQPAPVSIAPRRFGRFDLDQSKEQLARLPDLKECADALLSAWGH